MHRDLSSPLRLNRSCVTVCPITYTGTGDGTVLYSSEPSLPSMNPVWKPVQHPAHHQCCGTPSVAASAGFTATDTAPDTDAPPTSVRISCVTGPAGSTPSASSPVTSIDFPLDVADLRECDPYWFVVPPTTSSVDTRCAVVLIAPSDMVGLDGDVRTAVGGSVSSGGSYGQSTPQAGSSTSATLVSVWDCLPVNSLLIQQQNMKWYISGSVHARMVSTCKLLRVSERV
jgi:hypothetical protein